MVAVLRPEVFGEAVYDALLIEPTVYGETPFADEGGAATVGGSFTANAILKKTISATFTADAVFASPTAGAGSFTADAVIRAERSASLTTDAIIRRTQTATLTADAALRAARSGSLTANSVIQAARTGSYTANAVLHLLQTASFTVDAAIGVSFRADAVLRATQTVSFTVSAWIYAPRADPGGPGEPGETPLVSILVDDEDVTRDVVMLDATFTMLVNGAVGTCSFRVRDDGHSRHFITGSEVTLDIDGKRRWGGYLMQPRRMLAFPVVDTADPDDPSRFHVLTGVDYNILLAKRIVRNKANPNQMSLRKWAAGSRDDVVIKYVFDNYTDLGADGVTYNGVTHIGSPNPDKAGVVGSGGHRFLDTMVEVNRLISGVFYIDAYKDLNYVDVDTPDAEFGLSDRPGAGQVGYRELTKTNNGAGLVNDALLWGIGLGGGSRAVFARSTDAASIAAHGLWQMGEFTTALFRQASVDLRAETIVYGTPQGKRGGKDDQESWRVVVFEPTFEVGQKVAIESEVYGLSDVLPIRRYTVTFPTKSRPRFELVLSHEIDEPWNLFEFWLPKFPPFDFGRIDIGNISVLLPECGIFDDFDNRTISVTTGLNSLGIVSSGGYEWKTAGAAGAASVSGGVLNFRTTGNVDRTVGISPQPSWPLPVEYLFHYDPANLPSGHSGNRSDFILILTDQAAPGTIRLDLNLGHLILDIDSWDPSGDGEFNAALNQHNWIRVRITETSMQIRLWAFADPEPLTWNIVDSPYSGAPDPVGTGTLDFRLNGDLSALDYNVTVDDMRVWVQDVEIPSCSDAAGRSDQSGSGSETVFTTTDPYQPGSLRVFVGGYLQRLTLDYVETDPEAGTVTFAIAPGLAVAITFLYEIART